MSPEDLIPVGTAIMTVLVILLTGVPIGIILHRVYYNTLGKKAMVSMPIPGDGFGRIRLLPREITFAGLSIPASGPARTENGASLSFGALVQIIEREKHGYLVRPVTDETKKGEVTA
ncbi:hypothetical protein BH09SUM1_BH09SUM1_26030 [soil metagenome]